MNDLTPGPKSFASKSASWRVIVLAAGVIMNVLLAYVLLSVQAATGFPTVVTEKNAEQLSNVKTYIMAISPDSPAAQAQIKQYDRIVRINEAINPRLEQVQDVARKLAGQSLTIELERQGEHQTVTLIPRTNPPEGQGALGVHLASTGLTKVSWWQAPLIGLQRTSQMFGAILSAFGETIQKLFREGNVGETLTGPIGIAKYTQEATAMGLSYLLEFIALISLNLAIINILPLPALDGGRILFVALEKILGRRLPGKIEQLTHNVGFALLILLMILITVKDVRRFF